ncbi:site-2 protease family protein [Candidatus Uhrbacteria bacterium]|jgi:Zn-dependent protease|nr:site-2 protease family protein [Candidatus Uhrbacteria bacterium]
MFISLLTQQPFLALVWLAVILMSLTVHEFAHALAAERLGDRTAEAMGRLTLNPVAHIDPVGFIPLLLLGFGWAKPVPFNPYNLEDPKWDSVKIALAGPASNLIVATLSAIAFRGLDAGGMIVAGNALGFFLILLIIINLYLLFFNIIPIHPLDGSKLLDALLTKPEHQKIRRAIAQHGPRVLLILVFLSFMTSFNVFFFISVPSEALCDLLIGGRCF